ncbi:MAG: hypothetical protein GY800_01700, partial [Planctomycetes bacterium]|nr:hypothetical protein [Planctomycetota bacterium]
LKLLLKGTDYDIIEKTFLEPGHFIFSHEDISRRLNMHPSGVKEALAELTKRGVLVEIKDNSRVFSAHRDKLSATKTQIVRHVEEFHRANPVKRGIEDSVLRTRLPKGTPVRLLARAMDDLRREGIITTTSGNKVAMAGYHVSLSESDKKTVKSIEDSFLKDRLAPPALEKLLPKDSSERDRFRSLFNLMVEEGTLIEIKPALYFHAKTVEELKERL